MPNDLERAFAALSDDTTRQARLAPAAQVRKRADRQTLTRSVTGVAAAVVLVAGVLVGSRLALSDNALPPLPPAESIAPTPAPPSVTPSPSLSSPSSPPASEDGAGGPGTVQTGTPAIPGSVPTRAFLTRAETNAGSWQRLRGATPLTLCSAAAGFASEKKVGVRGTVEILVAAGKIPADLYEDGKDPDTDYYPLAVVSDTVTVYRADGARVYLDEMRRMVKDCPKGGNGATYRSLGSLGLGDESVLIQGSTPARGDDGEPMNDGTRHYTYYAEVRIADTVVTVHYAGYESQSVERADAESLTRKAFQRARDWRG
jgi:hypothetical protein